MFLLLRNVQVSVVYPGLIDTGMFFGVNHRFPRITPPLDPKYVSKEIIAILDSGRGQDIKLPFYGNLVGILRLLPREFSDWVREVCLQSFSYLVYGC